MRCRRNGHILPGKSLSQRFFEHGSTRSSTPSTKAGITATLRIPFSCRTPPRGDRHNPEPGRPGGFGQIEVRSKEKTAETGPCRSGMSRDDPARSCLLDEGTSTLKPRRHLSSARSPRRGRNTPRGVLHDERDMGSTNAAETVSSGEPSPQCLRAVTPRGIGALAIRKERCVGTRPTKRKE
jgi:hypothetical protein